MAGQGNTGGQHQTDSQANRNESFHFHGFTTFFIDIISLDVSFLVQYHDMDRLQNSVCILKLISLSVIAAHTWFSIAVPNSLRKRSLYDHMISVKHCPFGPVTSKKQAYRER